jgi:small subunit ribosomal protein S4
MARYIGPKNRLSRREGVDLFGKGIKLRRPTTKPGMHGTKRGSKPTSYGTQLRAKQVAKRFYGIQERQFRNYFLQAGKTRGNTAEELIVLLERRLDNVVYRLGLAPTRPAARQLVSHGHILVNGKKVNVPSFQTKIGDTVELDEISRRIPYIEELVNHPKIGLGWLEREESRGKIVRYPTIYDLPEPISLSDIIEFYSR